MSPLAGLRNLLASHTEMPSARNHQDQGFPAVPASLNAGDYEMQDYSQAPPYTPPANTAPYYTPYLGLRARLSQIWINRWTVLLILVIVRLLLATSGINSDLAHAKTEALSACTSVEHVGSAMASMPHYLSEGVNALAADGVTKAMQGLGEMLMLSLTGVEEIVTFVINLMTSTYVCLITLAVSGSLQAEIKIIEDVGKFMNQSIGSITGTMSSDLSSFQNSLNSFLKDINIGGLLGGSKSPPTVDLTSQINALKSIKIDPSKMDADLTKLNDSIPTFAQVQNFTNNVIAFPFEEVKKLVNESIGNYTFDKSVFSVAQKQQLTFCSDNNSINDFFDSLHHIVFTARKIFLIVLIILAILVCIPMAYREIWRWRSMQQRSILLQKHAFDPMDVIYIASRPMTSTTGIKLSSKLHGSTKRQIFIRWFIAYITHPPVLFVLALGIAGLFSCFCQFLILKAVHKEVPTLVNKVSHFADGVVGALNNASTSWAIAANGVIDDTSTKVNSDVFGWVYTSTTAVNSTLNAFADQMTTALNETFGGTILYKPIMGVFDCLVGLKIAGIEKGLTWVHDNAHVNFPEFRPDVFSLGAAASLSNSSDAQSFLAAPGNTTSDEISGAVVKVAEKFERMIRREAIIAACLIGVWVFVALMGLGYLLYSLSKRDKTRAEGGPVYTSSHGNVRDDVGGGGMYPVDSVNSMFPQFRGPVSGGQGHGYSSSQEGLRGNEDEGWGDIGLEDDDDGDEKVRERMVGQGTVVEREGFDRKSSYGYVADSKC